MMVAGLLDMLWQRFWPQPDGDASRPRRVLWAVFRIVAVFCREFQRNNLPLRSSALTFTIVLSLVPTLALGTAVLKGLGADVQPVVPADGEGVSRMAGHLHLAIAKIFDYVERTDFAALGAFGVIGLVIAVLSVLGRIEQAMNVIWRADVGRPMGRKLMDYLALMILLPLSVNLGFAAEAMLRNQKLFGMVSAILPIEWFSHLLFSLLPMFIVIVTFSVLYRFLPNVKVRVWPALVGGIMGGLSWFLIQAFYVKLQIGVAKYNAIYGSFATLPLFLLWLNIAWIVFLSGAEFSYACQVFEGYVWQPLKLSSYNRLALSFDLLDAVFVDFKERRLSSLHEMEVRHRQYGPQAVAVVLQLLVDGGLLRQVEGREGFYVPAAPMSSFSPADVVNLVWGGEHAGRHVLVEQALSRASRDLAWPEDAHGLVKNPDLAMSP